MNDPGLASLAYGHYADAIEELIKGGPYFVLLVMTAALIVILGVCGLMAWLLLVAAFPDNVDPKGNALARFVDWSRPSWCNFGSRAEQ